MTDASQPTVLIVPGLRDAVAGHWQTILAERLERVLEVPAVGRSELGLPNRVLAIENLARQTYAPLVVVAHSAGCIMVAHWLRISGRRPLGVLFAAPPDFETPMPANYPTMAALATNGWLPVPRQKLACPSIVLASRNDPLARFVRVADLARDWGSRLVDLGEVGHLNPASGFGEFPYAEALIRELSAPPATALDAANDDAAAMARRG